MRPLERLAALLLLAIFLTSLPSRAALAGSTCEDACNTHDGAFEGCGQSKESLRAEEECKDECRRQDRLPSSGPSVPAPPTGECAETGTMEECSVCCSDHHAAAFEAFSEDLRSCLCQSDVCGSACASACANHEVAANDACVSCVEEDQQYGVGSCTAMANERCRDSDDCAAMIACMSNGCRGKQ
jgi:hypothetical protein